MWNDVPTGIDTRTVAAVGCNSQGVDELVLPCRCAPTARARVEADVIHCLDCGSTRPFVRRPLYLVTGAPATGKSTLVAHLADRVPSVAVFDTDLFGPWSHPDWTAWASGWLLVAHGLAQSSIDVLLVGYGLSRSKAQLLAPRVLLGPIKALNLDLNADELRARLRARPGYDEQRIERKVSAARQLSGEADENIDITTTASPDHVAAEVQRWLDREMPG